MISRYASRYVPAEIRMIFGLIVLACTIGLTYRGINAFIYHYMGFDYLPFRWLILSPVVFAVLLLGLYAKDKSPKLAFFTITYTTYFFILFSFAVLTNGMQYTPFPTIDRQLLIWDQWLHFNSIIIIHWTALHAHFKKILMAAYEFLDMEIIFVPLLIPWFYRESRVYELFIMMLVGFILGTTIYYFFPTAALTSVLHSPDFLPDERATATKFFEIHHYLPVTTGNGGMIAFPSFHVTWAIVLTYALRGKKFLFYPFAVINFVVILSALLLGWHYLVDAMAAVILVLVTWQITRQLLRRYSRRV